MASNDALVTIFARNSFYKHLHYLALSAFVLTLLVMGALSWILVFLIKHPTQPQYFAADSVGRLIQEIPISKPNMINADVIAWATEAVQNAYSYDYVNYRSDLQNAQKYFTNYGWSNYMEALTSSNNLLALAQRKQIVIAQVVGQVNLVADGLLGRAYAWKFEMPLLVTYWEPPYDDNSKFYNPLVVTMIVQRQPILQSYKGLGIVQLIAKMPAASNQPQEISGTPGG